MRPVALLVLFAALLTALPSAQPAASLSGGESDFVKVGPDLHIASGLLTGYVGAPEPPTPIVGIQNIFVIFVYFTDVGPSVSLDSVVENLNEVKRYYSEASYGQVYVEWHSHDWSNPWLQLPNTMAYYGAPEDTEGDARRYELVVDSLSAADPYVDYRNYEYVLIVHAGSNEAITGDANDIWSFAYMGGTWSTADGDVQLNVAVVSESDFVGVIAHEVGHLFWLPDLYDYKGATEFVGRWCLMAAGSYNGPLGDPGSSPAQLLSWCRLKLGWVEEHGVVEVSAGMAADVELAVLESPTGVKCVRVPLSSYQYYLVEARERRGFDACLPGEGVLILFVDESRGSGEGIVRVVDSTPDDGDVDNGAWGVGQTFYDVANNVTISITSATDSTYAIRVERAVAAPKLTVGLGVREAAPGDVIEVTIRDTVPMSYAYAYFEDHFLTVIPVEGAYEVKVRVVVPTVEPGNYSIRVLAVDSEGTRSARAGLSVVEGTMRKRLEALEANLLSAMNATTSELKSSIAETTGALSAQLTTEIESVLSAVNLARSTVVDSVSSARADILASLASATSAIAEIEGGVASMASSLATLGSDIDALKTELSSLGTALETVTGRVADIAAGLAGVQANVKEFGTLVLATLGVAALSALLAGVGAARKR